MKEKILEIINNHSYSYTHHGMYAEYKLVFEHEYDSLAEDLEKLFKSTK